MQTEMENDIHQEPMATRVALHPFLAGMNKQQLALLDRLRDGRSLQEGPGHPARR